MPGRRLKIYYFFIGQLPGVAPIVVECHRKHQEIPHDQRPGRKVAAMFIDTAFGAPMYERLRSLGYQNVHEVNFGQTHTPDRTKANMRAYMWDQMKD